MRIFFTGGSGKAGKHVATFLAEQGHQVTNADLVPLRHPSVADLKVDLTDAGEVYSALAGLARFEELELAAKPAYDAVVHFAAVPAILLTSEAKTYATNVLSTYNVLEAATRLGVRKVIFASSETTYGVCFAQGERRPLYVPVDEEHPTVPEDSYAMSKVANEVTARSFQARTGVDIYGLRINNVIEPHEYAEMFPPFLEDPALRRRNIFAYIDTRDLGQMVQRCLEVDGLGYEVFNVANADMSVAATTDEVRERFYDGVERAAADGAQRDLLRHRQGPRPPRLLAAALVARRPAGPSRVVKAKDAATSADQRTQALVPMRLGHVEHARVVPPDLAGYLLGVGGDGRLDVEQPRRAGVIGGPAGIAAGRKRRPRVAHLL